MGRYFHYCGLHSLLYPVSQNPLQHRAFKSGARRLNPQVPYLSFRSGKNHGGQPCRLKSDFGSKTSGGLTVSSGYRHGSHFSGRIIEGSDRQRRGRFSWIRHRYHRDFHPLGASKLRPLGISNHRCCPQGFHFAGKLGGMHIRSAHSDKGFPG